MKRPIHLWLLLGMSLSFVVMGIGLFRVNRDPGALMPILFFGACAGVFGMQLREGRKRKRAHWPILEGDSFVLRRKAGAIRIYALLSIMMGLGGGVIVIMESGLAAKAMGLFGLVFFGGGGLYLLRKRGKDTTALRVDARGIAFDDGPEPKLRWDQLGGVGIVAMHGETFLGFSMREGADVRADDSAFAQMGGRLNERLGYPDFSVTQVGLDEPLEQVAEAIERLRGRYA